MLKSNSILGVSVTNASSKNILEYLLKRLKTSLEKTFIITPNPEMLVYASKHLDYQDKLNSADIALPDGVGLFFAGGLLGKPLKDRIPGVDFMEELCKVAREKPLSMGFLGGKAGIAERTVECLLKKYPYLDIVFVSEEWSESGYYWEAKRKTTQKMTQNYAEKFRVVQRIVSRGSAEKATKTNLHTTGEQKMIDILFVAFGVPKQEEWIYANLDKLPVKAAMGVGGAFDFLSGKVRRAPFIIRFIGLEWLFRLIVQPWRWKRQLALMEFIILVFREFFSEKK